MELMIRIALGLFGIGIIWAFFYQLVSREPPAPGFLEEWDMMADFEPDTRSLEERLEEQRRLLRFEKLID